MVSYRRMVRGDVPSALSLSRLAGWNQTQQDWELFLDLSPTGCFVAVDADGKVHGTVATVRYQHHFSWIGMVLVHPSMQRRGIGIQLLREALHELGDEETIKLDATPAGRQVYVQLDFIDEYAISRLELSHVPASLLESDSQVRPLSQRDIRRLVAFDDEVFGGDRSAVLEAVRRRAPRFAFVVEGEGGAVAGYCLGRSGERFTHIGPVVAKDIAVARNLCSAALKNSPDRPVVIDALRHTREWMEWLSAVGFREQRPLVRMYRGSNKFPGIPQKQFAILGPEFG